jgi:hypothetical protein
MRGVALAAMIALSAQTAKADEGGMSFWVPGFFGSLAATPQHIIRSSSLTFEDR